MSIVTIILVGLALSMDACAVSLATGVAMCKIRIRPALRMAFSFGFFQAIMPILGWSVGQKAVKLIEKYDHWVAFSLLFIVGIKMIYEALKKNEGEEKILRKTYKPLTIPLLLTLSLATSIDAAAVGLSLSFLNVNIIEPAIIIGIITFCVSLSGIFLGCKIGDFFGSKIEIVGGIILVGIGIKILIEHIFLS